ncbi:MAG: DNA gyrase inhibitor YacG [Rhodobacterales bacterium]|nr:DNA gyrase inhibitor YacG [Pseudomonadota bacterium]NQW15451.1 DNA gyrase inhibitor YacG [Rhodobacter sp.]
MSCPICSKPPSEKYRPFCSKRCADIDLGKWFNESYSVPSAEIEGDEEKAESVGNPSRQLH